MQACLRASTSSAPSMTRDYPGEGAVEVQNNVWVVGGDDEVVVIDASHDATPIVEAVGGPPGHRDRLHARTLGPRRRRVRPAAERSTRRSSCTPADVAVWRRTHADRTHDRDLAEGDLLVADGVELRVLHTPGHTPGSVCFHHTASHVLFAGDTLFPGGPGSTGDELGDFEVIIASIRERILTMPPQTEVHPGHGDSTTVGEEAPHLQEWIERGW